MKKIILTLNILMSLLIASCSNDDIAIPTPPSGEEGQECTFTFKVKIPDMTSTSRALTGNASEIKTFKLLVFDKASRTYLYERTATQLVAQKDGGTFTVNLVTSTEPRIIHFVATHDQNLTIPYQLTEYSVLSQLHVSDYDAYWQRKSFDNGINSDMQALSTEDSPIIMIRNVARITLTSSTNKFKIVGFTIVNAPTTGSIAPYYQQPINNEYFFEYITSATKEGVTNATNAYDAITTNYIGVPYKGDLIGAPDDITPNPISEGSNVFVQYMYERTQVTTPAFIVVKRNIGTEVNPTYKYYKLDILRTNIETGEPEYYKILRNFSYNLTIEDVADNAVGYDDVSSASGATASNNISVSADLKDLTSISYEDEHLYVSKTEIVWTTNNNIEFKFKYINDNDEKNREVKFYFGNSKVEGQRPVYNEEIDYKITYNDGDFATISIPTTGLVSKPYWKEQEVIVKAGNLSRTVNLMLIQPYEMELVCYDGGTNGTSTTVTDKIVNTSIDKHVRINIKLPEGMPESIFPLTFYIEAEKNSLHPNSNNHLPVETNIASLFNGGNTFGYNKKITYEEYYNATTKTYNRTFTCNFKTNVANNASRVRVYNEYFSVAEDFFANTSFTFGRMTINGVTPFDDTGITIHYHADRSVLGNVTYAQLKAGVTIPMWVDTSDQNTTFCYFTYVLNGVTYRTQEILNVNQAKTGVTLNSAVLQ